MDRFGLRAGITAALDIGFSNWSFQYITISLYGEPFSYICSFVMNFLSAYSTPSAIVRVQYSVALHRLNFMCIMT